MDADPLRECDENAFLTRLWDEYFEDCDVMGESRVIAFLLNQSLLEPALAVHVAVRMRISRLQGLVKYCMFGEQGVPVVAVVPHRQARLIVSGQDHRPVAGAPH